MNNAPPTFIQTPGNLSITNLQNGAATTISNLANGPHAGTAAGIILTKTSSGNSVSAGKIRKEKRRNWQCEICHNRFSRKDHLGE